MIDAAGIDRLRVEFRAELARAASDRDLQALRDKYLGRKHGVVVGLLKAAAAAPRDDRPALGRLANTLKQDIEDGLAQRAEAVAADRPPPGAVDVTLPGRDLGPGHRHPVTALRERIESIFTRMGYQVIDGPEVEDEYHNFEALNIPSEHPARDMQDTLYLGAPLGTATLLRTHTSGMQIRYMEAHQPPIRIIAPGKVYRRDNFDASHTPMFHQVEGLVVGEDVTMADLKGTLVGFLRQLFSPDTRVLFRPTFFPYTEPSADIFIGCLLCGGAGCAVCKKTGWLEVLGSGMVHPAVFEAVGYDPERYTGFAFGVGIERLAMLIHGVDDIRAFYENDLRFLEQFAS